MKLLINVGGKGQRMGDLTKDLPKPMLSLNGKPILEHLIQWAKQYKFAEIVLLCGYKYEVIQDYFGNGNDFGIQIQYSVEPEPLGSGGPIKFAEKFIDSTFAYINGDLFCQVDFDKMTNAHQRSKAIMTVLLHESTHPQDSDILKVDDHNRVIKFISKHDDHTNAGNLGNAGLCIMEPDVLQYMDIKKFTFETYVYPKLLAAGKHINAYITDELICDIGTVERLKEIEILLNH